MISSATDDRQEIATPDNTSCKVRSQRFTATKQITYTAVFGALALAMKFIGQYLTLTPSFKLTPIYVVWTVAAAVLGPIGGGAVCFISDTLGALIFPVGAINPLLSLGCTLYGVIAGVCYRYLPVKSHAIKMIFSSVVCLLLVTLLFDSFAIWYWCKYYLHLGSFADRSFWVYVATSRTMQAAVAAINIPITVAMIPVLLRLRLLPSLKDAQKQNNI